MTDTNTPLNYAAGQSGVWLNQGTSVSIGTSEISLTITLMNGRPILVNFQPTVACTIGTVMGSTTTPIAAGGSYNMLVYPQVAVSGSQVFATTTVYVLGAGSGSIVVTPLDDTREP